MPLDANIIVAPLTIGPIHSFAGICFDYLRNQCQRGLLCRFSHDLSNIAQQCQVMQGPVTDNPPA